MRLIRAQTSTPLSKNISENPAHRAWLPNQTRARSPSHLAAQAAIEIKARGLLFLRRKVFTQRKMKQLPKQRASSVSAFLIVPPKVPSANVSKRSAGSATARNGVPDAKGASAWPSGDTVSTAAGTKVRMA